MKPLMKFFIYCSIIVIIGLFNNAEAKQGSDDLKGQEPPKEAPQEPPHAVKAFRSRRDVGQQQGDEPEIPKEMSQHFRSRRDVAERQGDEPDVPEEMPKEPPSRFRTKRQIPSPPEGVPQPPPPPMPPM